MTKSHGRGVIAIKEIKKGELILVEKATIVALVDQ